MLMSFLNKKHKGFSVAQLMMILLTISITMAASMPIITRKFKVAVKPTEEGKWACIKNKEGKLQHFIGPKINSELPSLDGSGNSWKPGCSLPPFPENISYIFVQLIGGGAAGQAPIIEVIPPGKITYLNRPKKYDANNSSDPLEIDLAGVYEITITGTTGEGFGLMHSNDGKSPEMTSAMPLAPFEFRAKTKEGAYNFALSRYDFKDVTKVHCPSDLYSNAPGGLPVTMMFKMPLAIGDSLVLAYETHGGMSSILPAPKDMCGGVQYGIRCGGTKGVDYDGLTGDCLATGEHYKDETSIYKFTYAGNSGTTYSNKYLYNTPDDNSEPGNMTSDYEKARSAYIMTQGGFELLNYFEFSRPTEYKPSSPQDGFALVLKHKTKLSKDSPLPLARINGPSKGYWFGNDYEHEIPKCALASCNRYVSYAPEQLPYMDNRACADGDYTSVATHIDGEPMYKIFDSPVDALINGCDSSQGGRTKYGIARGYKTEVDLAGYGEESLSFTKVPGGYLGLFASDQPAGNQIKLLDPVSVFTAGCGGAAGETITSVISLAGVGDIKFSAGDIGNPGIAPQYFVEKDNNGSVLNFTLYDETLRNSLKNGERGGDIYKDGRVLGSSPTATRFLGVVANGGQPNVCGDNLSIPQKNVNGVQSFASFGGAAYTAIKKDSLGGAGAIFGYWEDASGNKFDQAKREGDEKYTGKPSALDNPTGFGATSGAGAGAGGGGGAARQRIDPKGFPAKDGAGNPDYEILLPENGTGGAIIITWQG